ncbi:MAG: tetratricopeptide repeat protein [Gemmatimonadetes bacterium]|nr:tetratricopeptide repeat protein [Gemmatimonadota bacterium]MBT6145832.1 tetratricopeptide repeat protein [Gemmatimonadota bacterium]MBT7861967.1 tetratricopeptide repeat protein [Gemmatimonadota bacterium]
MNSTIRTTLAGAVLALATLQLSHAETPTEAISHYRSGYELLQAKDFRNAAIELEHAVQIDSTYGDALYALGMAHASLQDYDKSATALEGALRHGTSRQELAQRIPRLLGDLYFKAALKSRKQRRYGEAIDRFSQSLIYRQGNAQAYFSIGTCHLQLRQRDKARTAFEAAIKADAKYKWPYVSLGNIHRRAGEFAQAKKMYQMAISLDGQFAEAFEGLAHVQIASDDLDGAVETLRKAVAINDDFVEGFVLIGTALNQLGRHGEAIAPLQRAVTLESKNADAHYRLAESHLGVGSLRDAVISGKRAVGLQRDFHAAEVILADAHYKLGQMDEARRLYTAASTDSRFKDYCQHQLEEMDRPVVEGE